MRRLCDAADRKKEEHLAQLKEESKKFIPQPERYDEFLINRYALPRGLVSGRREECLSESERVFQDRYSKKTLGLLNLEKIESIVSLSTYKGFSGRKVNSSSN